MVDKTENVQIQRIDRALYLDDIFFTHFITFGIFDDCDRTVEFIQLEVVIDPHAHACLNMIEYKTLVNTTDI